MDISLNEMCESLCTRCANSPKVLAFILDFGSNAQIDRALESVIRDLTSPHTASSERAEIARVIAERNLFCDQGVATGTYEHAVTDDVISEPVKERKKPGRKPKVQA